jgi:ABC-type phosphate transport system ATPase subunit
MHEVVPHARIEGKVLLDDEDIYAPDIDPAAVRRTIGMVFQRPNPFPTMSIYDNVAAGLRLNGLRRKSELDDAVERSLRGSNLWEEVRGRLNKPGCPVGSNSDCASPGRSRWSPRFSSWTSRAARSTRSRPWRSRTSSSS